MKVLVIDDDRDCAESVADLLESERIEARWESDPAAGLRIARELRPDAILLDFAMPGMTGLEFVRAQRADPEIASIPVVLTTAMPRNALGDGGPYPPVLFKPFDVEALLRALRAALDGGAEGEVERLGHTGA